MGRRMVRLIAVVILGVLVLFVAASLYAALEAQLLVGASPSSDNVPYNQTQWYGFTATAGQGYRINLTPSTGNPDLYFFDTGFNRVGYSKSTGLTQDKVWFGQATSGPMHIAAYGVYNPSSNYTVQVITSPYLKTISPTSGTVGTLVTLTGFGFGVAQGTSYVKFGAVNATSYSSWTNTQIKVYVPSGIASGTIQAVVYVASKASNALNFTANVISSNGTMFRYDLARTGNYPNGPTTLPLNIKWSYSFNGPLGSPTVANNIVYVRCYDGKLYAFYATTGTLKWSYVLRGIGGSTGSMNSSPAIANGIVYVGTGEYVGSSSPTGYIGKLFALDANTGVLKWSYTTGNEIDSSPVVYNGVVYIGSRENKFYAFDANTGSLKWSYSAGAIGSAAIANGIVYFSDAFSAYALDAVTGVLKWKVLIGNYVYATPAINNNTLYITTGAEGEGIVAMDVNTGSIKWKYAPFSGLRGSGYNSPAVANSIVYFRVDNYTGVDGFSNRLYALDANTGTLKWSYDNVSVESPSVSNNIVYVGNYALDANTGALKWSYDTVFGEDVAIANGKIYVTQNSFSYTYALYCFGP